MRYLAAIEVDRRQQVITASDKLKEILGGSWNIEETVAWISKPDVGHDRVSLLMPVSGAIWLSSPDLEALQRVVWRFREELVDKLELSSTFAIVEYDDLDQGRRDADARIRKLKSSKDLEDGRPFAPLFASCRIQSDLPANVWIPHFEVAYDEQHKRRALMSSASEQRFDKGSKTLNRYLREFSEYDPVRFSGARAV
jgi:hypothetical protein